MGRNAHDSNKLAAGLELFRQRRFTFLGSLCFALDCTDMDAGKGLVSLF